MPRIGRFFGFYRYHKLLLWKSIQQVFTHDPIRVERSALNKCSIDGRYRSQTGVSRAPDLGPPCCRVLRSRAVPRPRRRSSRSRPEITGRNDAAGRHPADRRGPGWCGCRTPGRCPHCGGRRQKPPHRQGPCSRALDAAFVVRRPSRSGSGCTAVVVPPVSVTGEPDRCRRPPTGHPRWIAMVPGPGATR